MLDINYIREHAEAIKTNCHNRNIAVDVDHLLHLDDQRRELMTQIQTLQHERNQFVKSIKGRKPEASEVAHGKQLKDRISEMETRLGEVKNEYAELHGRVPNMAHPDSPVGKTDEDNKELRRWGTLPAADFEARDHMELARQWDLLDFEAASEVTGQKFYYLKNELVLLELAVIRYALDYLKSKSFTLFSTPDLARAQVAANLGFNPRGEETQVYSVADTDLVLIGTAEITLGGIHQNQILDASKLPLRYCGLSHCFRTEAGAAGRAGKGLYRVHQFTKVEMFVYATGEQSDEIHEELLAHEEAIFQGLEIPYRVVDICTGDLGAPAYRKYDLEAWMPSRREEGGWGEITSTSNCTDYQARRLKVRYKNPADDKNVYCHLLNGTAVSMARTLIALLENHQQADGSIRIPEKLVPYTGFKKIG